MEYVRDRADDVEAIVLTHGHEDHVGALPYLLRDLGRRVPVYATAFTLELLQGKLEEHEVTDLMEPHVAVPGGGTQAGPFRMRFFHVTPSIPDGHRRPTDRSARHRGGIGSRSPSPPVGFDERGDPGTHGERAHRRSGTS